MTATVGPSVFVEIGDVRLEVERRGTGPPLLLLESEEALERHGTFVEDLARRYEVIIPSAPGFGRSNRPEWITRPGDIAYIYLDLVDRLRLRSIVLLGFSLGGWIAAEMATKNDVFIAKLVLVDPYGIKVGARTEREIADIWLLAPDEVASRKWVEPTKYALDYRAMPIDQLRIIARNNESFARFCWEPYMYNPKLRYRLHRIGIPTLLIWGENDGIVNPAYGEAYQRLIPRSELTIIENAGHFPHVEQPTAVLKRVSAFLGGDS